jgi:hypothetical protein
MKAPSEKGKSHATTRIAPTAGKGDTGIDLEHTATRSIRVQCPNPACRKVHVVDGRLAHHKGRCSCGALVPIPAVGTAAVHPQPTAAPRPKEGTSRKTVVRGHAPERTAPVSHEGAQVAEVRIGCIGRGQAGKTVLFRCLTEHLVGDFFPSGLHADAGDPREVARMMRENEQARRLLRRCGLPPTEHVSKTNCYLYDGDEQRVVYKMREVIGQILTHTLPDSAAELQARYGEYLKNLVNTHVLWVMVPCPPANPTASDRRRYTNDLRITLAYLREALRLRPLKQPAAVALVLSKIDTLFENAEEARASLTDEVLLDALGPLVSLIERSKRVSEAVIAPVTAFGFGNAVLREGGDESEGAEDELLGAEPVWLLREGATPEPFNVNALFLWTLLAGLVHAVGPEVLEAESDLGALCRTLRGDLEAVDPWLVAVKGGQTPDETPGRRRKSAATTS